MSGRPEPRRVTAPTIDTDGKDVPVPAERAEGRVREHSPFVCCVVVRVGYRYSDFTAPHEALRVGVAEGQPLPRFELTPAPPCHVT